MTEAQVQAQEVIREHPAITIVGRVGWFAKGLVYLVAGVLALMVALRSLGWKTVSYTHLTLPTILRV